MHGHPWAGQLTCWPSRPAHHQEAPGFPWQQQGYPVDPVYRISHGYNDKDVPISFMFRTETLMIIMLLMTNFEGPSFIFS